LGEGGGALGGLLEVEAAGEAGEFGALEGVFGAGLEGGADLAGGGVLAVVEEASQGFGQVRREEAAVGGVCGEEGEGLARTRATRSSTGPA
jgi:hypothetical protein